MTAPGPIEPTRTSTIAVSGGALYAETFLPTGEPKGAVLVTHGYYEHCGRYREVAHVITNAGWAALTYDVRGHGKSFGPRGFVDRFDRYLDDLAAAAKAARALAPEKPLVLLAHSHGGLITLRALAGNRAPDACCAILSSPFLGLRLAVPGYKKLLARVASKVAPNFGQPNPLRVEDLTSDPKKQQERLADTLCFDTTPARWFTEALAAQQFVSSHADQITVPTTWLVGGADSIADPEASRRVASRARGATFHDLAGWKHEVFNEVDRGDAFAKVEKALAACSAASA